LLDSKNSTAIVKPEFNVGKIKSGSTIKTSTMPKINSYFLIAFDISIISLVLVALSSPFLQYAYAQLKANVTTSCENGNCTTTICINNQPCKTTNSNSTNITSFGGLIENRTVPKPTVPGEIV